MLKNWQAYLEIVFIISSQSLLTILLSSLFLWQIIMNGLSSSIYNVSYSQRLFLSRVLSSNVVKSLTIIHPPKQRHFHFWWVWQAWFCPACSPLQCFVLPDSFSLYVSGFYLQLISLSSLFTSWHQCKYLIVPWSTCYFSSFPFKAFSHSTWILGRSFLQIFLAALLFFKCPFQYLLLGCLKKDSSC